MKSKPAKAKLNGYTVTEVGTLLESLDKKISFIAEGHSTLDTRMEKLEVAVHGNSRRIDSLKLGMTVLDGKATRLEDAVSKLSKDLKDTRTDLKAEIHELGNRLTGVEAHP